TSCARRGRVWIDNSKTGAGQTVGEVQGRALQVRDAFVVDKKLHAIALDYCVAFFSFAKRHLVMQTGTAAFSHFYSQAFSRVFRPLRKQVLELSDSVVSDVDHRAKKYGCHVSKSKDTDGAVLVGCL